MTRDSRGRPRLPPERYGAPAGGIERVIVYRCANPTCGTHWPVRTRAKRFDSRCRLCDHRNTIHWTTSRQTWDDRRGRPRVVAWRLYDTLEGAKESARSMNLKKNIRRNEAVGSTEGFITASEFQARLDRWARRFEPE